MADKIEKEENQLLQFKEAINLFDKDVHGNNYHIIINLSLTFL